MKVAICCIVKNENKYIVEWIEHYKRLGFKKIFIYDNNDPDGENLLDVVQPYIDTNFVDVIDFKHKHKPQIEAYYNCYEKNKNDYDWIAFFDVDEFLHIYTNEINVFLSNPSFNDAKCIQVNWVIYGDNNQLKYYDAPVQFRFLERSHTYTSIQHGCVRKTILRGGIKNISWNKDSIHASCHMVDIFNPINKDIILNTYNGLGIKTWPWYICHEYVDDIIGACHLKHYFTKSTEEWIHKKIRGAGDGVREENIYAWISEYFKYNEFSHVKMQLMLNVYMKYRNKQNEL